MYKTSVLDPSNMKNEHNVPALFGKRLMQDLCVHICVKTGRFIIPGPGGLNIEASPGTEMIQMLADPRPTEHWMLPVDVELHKKHLVPERAIGNGIRLAECHRP